jgi:hypothetical protein
MTDTPDPASPPAAPAPQPPNRPDWATIVGVACIGAIAITAILHTPDAAKEVSVAAVGALAGWLGRGALKG